MPTVPLSFTLQILQSTVGISQCNRRRILSLGLLMTAATLTDESMEMVLPLPLLNAVGIPGQAGTDMPGEAISGFLPAKGVTGSAYHLAILAQDQCVK